MKTRLPNMNDLLPTSVRVLRDRRSGLFYYRLVFPRGGSIEERWFASESDARQKCTLACEYWHKNNKQ